MLGNFHRFFSVLIGPYREKMGLEWGARVVQTIQKLSQSLATAKLCAINSKNRKITKNGRNSTKFKNWLKAH